MLRPVRSLIRILWPQPWSTSNLLTPLEDAIVEIERRRKDPELLRRVEAYLENDIPQHFKAGPILYLARHVATPNFETLRFLHLIEPLGLPAVIGNDLSDKFVPKNPLKKAIGKLAMSTGISVKDGRSHESYERISIIDFNTANGKQFRDIRTHWGEPIAEFHQSLFAELANHPVEIVDESAWIDRQHRGDLLAHYKKFLALFIVHGILFEDYALEDREEAIFIERVLRPAYRFIEVEFGCRPLIAQLTPTSVESAEFWISYPKQVLGIIKGKLTNTAQ